jgi:hypothetical protein
MIIIVIAIDFGGTLYLSLCLAIYKILSINYLISFSKNTRYYDYFWLIDEGNNAEKIDNMLLPKRT